jgi:endonuclease III
LLSVENDKAADCLLNDLEKNPQAFVLACLMDRRVDARRAWLIPYEISKELGDFSLATLLEPSLNRYKSIFNKKSLHRYNDDMAEIFYLAIEKIHKDFQDNASKIWAGSPKSGSVVRQFLSFKGGGVKIATMATNILAREFKISMKDLSCIDVSPDFQVMKVFTRTGLARQNARKEELMYVAREFYPDYPGVLDWPAWQIGSKFCRTKEEPECSKCYLNEYCPKVL